ncbi:MAG: hypothetical protein ABIJ20_03430 [Nanoarchaeota archaeon]|nr:hypothetical protein [Nanoarchaeota archaeon]MBU1445439.1 hypothetical protein [Nanoarchaeota archaeon]MBU2420247.1 hypothetical protein [Nanoarchaeota archaeon]MBU2474990.1 hypothetical protein [Nanoarchaeota archaeon]
MIFDLKPKKDKEIQRVSNKALRELKEFYGIKNKIEINIIMLKDRKTFNALRNRKTPGWNTAFARPPIFSVFILDKKNFGKESSSDYSKEYYAQLIKHEISHVLFYQMMGDLRCPAWFAEGVALYTDGSLKRRKRPGKFEDFLEFYQSGKSGVYRESGFAVEVLVKKFGKGKLHELIKRNNGIRGRKQFDKLFRKIYGFNINYRNMNKLLQE